MESAGADRTLLKAFYTQYTAVLLIILTFTIGAFQRTIYAAVPAKREVQWAPRATVGKLVLHDVFTRDGAIIERNNDLHAVAQVLSQHDLNARVFLYVSDLGLGENSAGIRRSRIRLRALHDHLTSLGVPSHALILATIRRPSAADQLEFQFIEADG